jgi:hypothetical protein
MYGVEVEIKRLKPRKQGLTKSTSPIGGRIEFEEIGEGE